MTAYNYPRFLSGSYDFEVFEGPDAGDRYRDAELKTLDGKTVRLSNFLARKPLVLETGSMTCPMYGKAVRPMQELAALYPELEFVVMYVREAHPGERVGPHRTQQEKVAAAKASCRRHADRRIVLIDDLEGTAHHLYGAMPNSIFLIDRDGTVVFRSIWNSAEDMDEVLRAFVQGRRVVPRDLNYSLQSGLENAAEPDWYVSDDGSLDVAGPLTAFQGYRGRRSEWCVGRNGYREPGPQLVVQAWTLRRA